MLDIDHSNLNITPHHVYMFAQNAARRFGLCVFIKLTRFFCRAFFPPRCVCVENNFQIFQQPKTQHVYNLLLIKTSGNLNILPSWKTFSLSQSCIYQWHKHPVRYHRSYKGMSTSALVYCSSPFVLVFLIVQKIFLLTCVMSVFENTFDIQYKDSIQMSVIMFSADDWTIFLTRELLIGRECSVLADIGPKQDNLVTRPLEIHRQM